MTNSIGISNFAEPTIQPFTCRLNLWKKFPHLNTCFYHAISNWSIKLLQNYLSMGNYANIERSPLFKFKFKKKSVFPHFRSSGPFYFCCYTNNNYSEIFRFVITQRVFFCHIWITSVTSIGPFVETKWKKKNVSLVRISRHLYSNWNVGTNGDKKTKVIFGILVFKMLSWMVEMTMWRLKVKMAKNNVLEFESNKYFTSLYNSNPP